MKKERFLSKSVYEPGEYEYEKQKKENEELNKAIEDNDEKKLKKIIYGRFINN